MTHFYIMIIQCYIRCSKVLNHRSIVMVVIHFYKLSQFFTGIVLWILVAYLQYHTGILICVATAQLEMMNHAASGVLKRTAFWSVMQQAYKFLNSYMQSVLFQDKYSVIQMHKNWQVDLISSEAFQQRNSICTVEARVCMHVSSQAMLLV